MPSRILTDWKYILSLFVAVAGVVVTIWLWRIDHHGKSVSVYVQSQVSLEPTDKESVRGLQVLIDGKPVVGSFLSVLQFSNDGEKPIVTSDFEAPLEVRLLADASVARARVTAKAPDDIEAEISWDKKTVRLKPLLLNPKDKITLSVITSGGRPQFVTKARITGISSVPLIDTMKPAPVLWKKWGFATVALLFAIATMILNPIELLLSGKTLATFNIRSLAVVNIITAVAAATAMNAVLEGGDNTSILYYMGLSMLMFAVASSVVWALRLQRMRAD